MKQMTEQHLINAFGSESQANMRHLPFANQAETEGFPNVARLFRAIAHAEFVHAGHHYRELRHLHGGFVANSMAAFGPGDTRKNLELAYAGEDLEITEMYPACIEVAKCQGEKGAQMSFEWAYNREKTHRELYEKARKVLTVVRSKDGAAVLRCSTHHAVSIHDEALEGSVYLRVDEDVSAIQEFPGDNPLPFQQY